MSVTEINEEIVSFRLYDSDYNLINETNYTDSTHDINFTDLSDGIYYYNSSVYDIVDKERGLTRTDIKILKYLNDNDKVGMQGLCSYLDTSQANYLFQYEPYLIQLGLILRTPRGRAISDKGKLLLKEIK